MFDSRIRTVLSFLSRDPCGKIVVAWSGPSRNATTIAHACSRQTRGNHTARRSDKCQVRTGAAGARQGRAAPTERREALMRANAPARWLSERPAVAVASLVDGSQSWPLRCRRQSTALRAVPGASALTPIARRASWAFTAGCKRTGIPADIGKRNLLTGRSRTSTVTI